MFGECKDHPGVKLERKYYGGKYAEYCPECRKNLFCGAVMEKVESIRRTGIFGENGHIAQQPKDRHYDCAGCCYDNTDTARCSMCIRKDGIHLLWAQS